MDLNCAKKELTAFITDYLESKEFQEKISSLLLSLCEIDTIPKNDITETSENETKAFNLLADFIKQEGLQGNIQFVPINATISEHQFFTPIYYSDSVSPYENRRNLIYQYTSNVYAGKKNGVALNAHIDTVAPYFKPYIMNKRIFGRGAGDDKGGCVAIAGALKILEQISNKYKIDFPSEILATFVIDEETGGNGSLSVASDKRLFQNIATMIVVESLDNKIHPANRGALWYKVSISRNKTKNPLYLMVKIIKKLEENGRSLKVKTKHELFPDNPQHTCQGVLGVFGDHPSRICPQIEMLIKTDLATEDLSRQLKVGLHDYINIYGDKTKVIENLSGSPKLKKHYELIEQNKGYKLVVHGNSGHMGSSDTNDNAITKMAYMIDPLINENNIIIQLSEEIITDSLVLEGGQGFLPPDTVSNIEVTIQNSIRAATIEYNNQFQDKVAEPIVTTDKLHNEAFERDPNSNSVKMALEIAKLLNFNESHRALGAPVSCDARIFAHEFQQMNLITTGPGHLSEAHKDEESIEISELAKGAGFLALYLLRHGGVL